MVLTFVMSIGLLFKAADLVAKGVDSGVLFKMFASGVPSAISFAIPVAVLGSALLVFGRLSADGEISALKACGVSLTSIMATPVIIGVVLGLVSLYINTQVAPPAHLERRAMLREYTSVAPLELIEPGRNNILADDLTIRVDERDGKVLHEIKVVDGRGGKRREVRAERGTVETVEYTDPKKGRMRTLRVHMENVRIIERAEDGTVSEAHADQFTSDLDIDFQARKYRKRFSDMTFFPLLEHIADTEKEIDVADDGELKHLRKELMRSKLEMHKRMVLALACIGFVFLAIPLGVKAQRRESWFGAAVCVIVLTGFYMFLIIAESLADKSVSFAHYILWLPLVCMVLGSAWLIRRQR